MLRFASTASRWPVALTLAALAACADDPTAPVRSPAPRPDADVVGIALVSNTNDAGDGSLRWALGAAPSGGVVQFDTALAGQTITLSSPLVASHPVTIEGPASKGITISGGSKSRVFLLDLIGVVTLRNLTITGGKAPAGTSAGAIWGLGDLVLSHTTVRGNAADGFGAIQASNLTLTNSTVSGNTSTAAVMLPALGAFETLTLINSTVAYNTGGGVQSNAGVAVRNSIIANNAGKNCFTAPGIYTGVTIASDSSCGGAPGILVGDPQLAPLADNGGPTMTHALAAGSPAINAAASCAVTTDQRHVPRDAQCDLGAYERAGGTTDGTTVTLTVDPGARVNAATGSVMVYGTLKCSRSDTISLSVELEQRQKVGRSVAEVRASAVVQFPCPTTLLRWGTILPPPSGAFQNGSAAATAETVAVPAGGTPASASAVVKLRRSRP
jgi:hypothetical protein